MYPASRVSFDLHSRQIDLSTRKIKGDSAGRVTCMLWIVKVVSSPFTTEQFCLVDLVFDLP